MDDTDKLQTFGQFLVEHLRDRALTFFNNLITHTDRYPTLQVQLRTEISPWNATQRDLIRQCLTLAVDAAIHDFLFQLGEQAENHGDRSAEHRIQILCDGIDITSLSDGIHGEAYGEDGWIATYSAFPSEQK